jgi:hypothetical protein
MSRADRIVKEVRYLESLEDAYRATLVEQLERCAKGNSWGLFGQNDLALKAAGRADHIPTTAADILEKGNAIAEIRQKLQMGPFELHETFREYRFMRGPNVPREPKLAAMLLAKINADPAASK